MTLLAQSAIAVVALLHIGFLILEMFLWKTPVGQRIFKQSAEQATASAVLAANQGLYNGFLAAGLIWGLLSNRPEICLFFLGCVIVAGIFGGLTAKRSILLMQALPGLVALVLVLVG